MLLRIFPTYKGFKIVHRSFASEPQMYYRTGLKDVAAIAFYAVGWITVHAILQEYVLDKLQRKLHLSKTKMSKFAESGQLFVFALYAAIHSGNFSTECIYLPIFIEMSSLRF